MGHTGRELIANRAPLALYILISVAAVARVVAPWTSGVMMFVIALSGICWAMAFGLFEIVYGPMLIAPRPARPGKPEKAA